MELRPFTLGSSGGAKLLRLFKNHIYRLPFLFSVIGLSFLLNSCGGSGNGGGGGAAGVFGPSVSGEPHAFRGAGVINDSKYLIGGTLAHGRVGDVLLQNDKIRVIIQKPRRNSGVALYGGNIIDADLTRGAGEPGHDTFGITMPLINVSWTPFYQKLEVMNADFTKGPVVVRASGVLNV